MTNGRDMASHSRVRLEGVWVHCAGLDLRATAVEGVEARLEGDVRSGDGKAVG